MGVLRPTWTCRGERQRLILWAQLWVFSLVPKFDWDKVFDSNWIAPQGDILFPWIPRGNEGRGSMLTLA